MIEQLNVMACWFIVAWAAFCILMPVVNDGIVGKILFTCTLLAALGVISGSSPVYLHLGVAAIGVRHIFLKTLWQAIKRAYVGFALSQCVNSKTLQAAQLHTRRQRDRII